MVALPGQLFSTTQISACQAEEPGLLSAELLDLSHRAFGEERSDPSPNTLVASKGVPHCRGFVLSRDWLDRK
jgi:hypothetical protein